MRAPRFAQHDFEQVFGAVYIAWPSPSERVVLATEKGELLTDDVSFIDQKARGSPWEAVMNVIL